MSLKSRLNTWAKSVLVVALAIGLPASGWGAQTASTAAAAKKQAPAKKSTTGKGSGKTAVHPAQTASKTKTVAGKKRAVKAAPTAQSRRLTTAFAASTQLRPMAQQLMTSRSAEAYSGVLKYAQTHPGDAAATAYLALGHAYMLDRRFADAASSFQKAKASGDALDDYADYLGAQAALQGGRAAESYPLLDHFAERHPGSIFAATAPVLLATAYEAQNNPSGALAVLQPLMQTAEAAHTDFEYALGRAYQMAGNAGMAAPLYRNIYLLQPFSNEAPQAKSQLQAMGVPLTAAERKTHADQLFNAKRYAEALEEYESIKKDDAGLSSADRDALAIYEAVCGLRLKRLTRKAVDQLPETNDDSAALKLYLYSELDRTAGDLGNHDAIVTQMEQKFPKSRWLEEALYSSGNMYLLRRDYAQAIHAYLELTKLFPTSQYAPSSHWHAAWLNYRLRQYPEAARLMDEQITAYPAGQEVANALYWRGRLYENEEHNFGQALNYYHAVSGSYTNYYYAVLARERISVLTRSAVAVTAPAAVLSKVPPPPSTELTEVPENDVHLIKARLLANAALNEYIAPEIQGSSTAGEWGTLAQAEIYASYGEFTRAMQSMKKSGISFFALPVPAVPAAYWHLLFPRPYWDDILADSQKNGLEPYLVTSLIRQESEFNPGAISRANAYGLMQLIPSTAKGAARHEGVKKFSTPMLLNPVTNLQLGTANLRAVLGRFGGQAEYALAAYNAGDVPVRQWMQVGDYKDVPEFVESIPYTETRDYVQAIVRNREMYQAVYPTGH